MPSFPVLALLGRLIVETGSPDALCPDLASAEEAIHARLGELEAGDAANWRVRYTIGHAPDAASGDFVRLELFDAGGEPRLSRDLPLAGESCATMAQVIALVVDRFFRAMVSEHELEQKSEGGAPPAPKAVEPADEGSRSATESRAPATSTLTAAAGVLLPPVSPTFGLAFTHRSAARLSLGLGLTWVVLPTTEALRAGGQAESRSAFLRLSPAWDVDLGAARLAFGPTLALGGERGTTTGLPESDVGYRMLAAAGVWAGSRLPLGRSLGLDFSSGLEAPFRPFGGAFAVDGQTVLKPPDLRAFVVIGAGPVW
jgi:hypothetical protein